MYRTLLFAVSAAIILFSIPNQSSSQISSNQISAEQWKQDVSYFLDNMEKVHINPYHTTSKNEFEKFAAHITSRISTMTDNQVFVEILRMTAMVGDGHSAINIFRWHDKQSESIFNYHIYPLRMYMFNDGIYVIGAAPQYGELTGKKITKINGKNINDVLEKIKPIVIGDNEYSKKFNTPYYLCNAEILNGLDITGNSGETEFTAADINGKEVSVKVSSFEMSKMQHNQGDDNGLPLYMRNNEKNYWFEYLPDSKTLYINYKRVLIDPADSLTGFCKRIREFVNANEIERTVVDIRNNGGGNNGTCQPFVNLISNDPKINRKGKLFVIIGRETFSAASYLATKLEFNTKAIFAGEPTGASPNHYGDNRPLILPNSKLEIRLSSIYWQNSFRFDTRTATEPQLKVELTPNDYFQMKDPVLEAILNYKPVDIQYKDYNKDITGSYIYSPLQLIDISAAGENLNMVLKQPDFLGRNVNYISTSLYAVSDAGFNTDIEGLSVTLAGKNIKLNYRGNEWEIEKAGNDFKTPAQLIEEGRYDKLAELIKETWIKDQANPFVSENVINGMGYNALGKDNLDGAIALFKLNVELYPASFNAYDSLGEAYMTAGNKELAIENYKRSVELNPNNKNGKQMIEHLSK